MRKSVRKYESNCRPVASTIVAWDFEFAADPFSLVCGQRETVVVIIIVLNDPLRVTVWAGTKNRK